ncbi:MAG: protein-s-isoprenylcysteine methyltransferase-like protein [Rhodospirillaceae bacterium]|nr:MAG: protein-s-isoprenylcysteine methyltransferase-like protein [Rhodospirillaceae bacterium]
MNKLELKVPPPAAALLVALAMWLVAYGLDGLSFALPERRAASIVLVASGVAISAAGTWSFWRARTTVNPTRPEAASSLVATGVYRLTRNPMYLGLFLVLAGWAAHLANAAILPGPLLFALYITRFQILPEERVLAAKFGRDFEAYRHRTRRWI